MAFFSSSVEGDTTKIVDSLTQHNIVDTLHQAAQTTPHGEEKGNLFAELIHHVFDSREIELPFLGHLHLPHFYLFGTEIYLTKHIVFLLLAALLLMIILPIAAKQNAKNKIPKGFGNLIEIFIVFIRDEIVLPNMGKGGLPYLPYLLTTFFFILIMNLLGMIPYGASATGNISVTAGLALIAFIMIQFSAIKAQGLKHYLAHLTGGVHWGLWIIMVPIEFLGLFTKPLALCIRLFANMTAGHIAIVAILGLNFLFKSYAITPIPVVLAVGVSLLEIFVAFLQAYVFTMLTALFMGFGIQSAHHDEEHH